MLVEQDAIYYPVGRAASLYARRAAKTSDPSKVHGKEAGEMVGRIAIKTKCKVVRSAMESTVSAALSMSTNAT